LEDVTAATMSPSDSAPGLEGPSAFLPLCDLPTVALPDEPCWPPEPQAAIPRQLAASAATIKSRGFREIPTIMVEQLLRRRLAQMYRV
jgi:hypothetical protein